MIEPGDRLCIEGNNQKQADFLAKNLVKTDVSRVRNLHLVQSVLSLSEHMELHAKLVEQGKIRIGAIHTYFKLYARYFMDLIII